MNSIAVKLLVFSLGIGLAFAVVLLPRLRLTAPAAATKLATATGLFTDNTADREQDRQAESQTFASEKSSDNSLEKRGMLSRNAPAELSEESVKRALNIGTLESLQLLRAERLELKPDYRGRLVKELKTLALENLVRRFSEDDWSNWPSSAIVNNGRPSVARAYLDDLTLVNPELGRYLETAALLFNAMHKEIMNGARVHLQDELNTIIDNAEELLLYRRTVAVPARLMLDQNILQDAEFINSIMRVEQRLVLLYIKRFPEDFVKHFEVLAGINLTQPDAELSQGVEELINHFALETSVNARRRIAGLLFDSAEIFKLAEYSSEIRRALAGFYLICAIDEHQAGYEAPAQEMLNISRKIYPSLKAQDALNEILVAANEKKAIDPEQPESEAKAKFVTESDSDQENVEPDKKGISLSSIFNVGTGIVRRGLEQLVMFTLLLLGLGYVAGRLLLVYITRRSQRASLVKPKSGEDELGMDKSYGGALSDSEDDSEAVPLDYGLEMLQGLDHSAQNEENASSLQH